MTKTCTFIAASSLNLSEQGWDDLSNNSNITWGDGNRTLYTPERLLQRVEFENPDDIKVLEEINERFGGEIEYIDLEN